MKTELTGTLVRLRPLREGDLRQRADWTSDAELVALMGADPSEEPFVSPEDEERRNGDWLADRQNLGDQLYAIEIHGRYIGDVDIEFFPQAHRAELTVFIGDRSAWGKGYGTETVRLVLDELRGRAGVNHAEVDAPRGNDRALAFWEKLGFRHYRTDDGGRRWLELSLCGSPQQETTCQ
jgi:RimJ/RimL family protein N-acetyltransferase